jgi:RNA 3'-terminal phosphate cyclase (ATP)
MIEIDGSLGEGGGQILRTSLGLSALTGKSFHMTNIRAGREKPGLRKQHLACVRAARKITDARCSGDFVGSREIVFQPGRAIPGEYGFDIGSAGSGTLVLQTIIPPLLATNAVSTVTVTGGTHNTFAPPYHFLAKSFSPLLARIGLCLECDIERYGFYPRGGGIIRASVSRPGAPMRLHLTERGKLLTASVHAVVSNLSEEIARSEADTVARGLGLPGVRTSFESVESDGPGNAVMIELSYENVTEVFTGFGEMRKHRDRVAGEALAEALEYAATGAPVGKHLADQLLVPLAAERGGSFLTCEPTLHTRTNAIVVRMFMRAEIRIERAAGETYRITVDV